MIARWLFNISGNLHCRLIKINGRPYIERYYLGTIFGVTFYLHRYLDPDGDRDRHDHPWLWSVGIPLTGGYTEERVRWLDPKHGPVCVMRKIRWLMPNFIMAAAAHRIASVKPNTWTLFFHYKRVKGWGFFKHTPGTPGVLYHQHLSATSESWPLWTPLGRYVAREPFSA